MTNAQNLKVLLVEDSTVICNLIANIVNNVAGVSVAESVGSEADAIEAVNHGNVDVVILDLQLRSGTGFGVLRAMRKMARRPEVVVLTNFALQHLPRVGARAGRAAFPRQVARLRAAARHTDRARRRPGLIRPSRPSRRARRPTGSPRIRPELPESTAAACITFARGTRTWMRMPPSRRGSDVQPAAEHVDPMTHPRDAVRLRPGERVGRSRPPRRRRSSGRHARRSARVRCRPPSRRACFMTFASASWTIRNKVIAPARLNAWLVLRKPFAAGQVGAPARLVDLPSQCRDEAHRVEQGRAQLLDDAALQVDALVERDPHAFEPRGEFRRRRAADSAASTSRPCVRRAARRRARHADHATVARAPPPARAAGGGRAR